MNTNLQDAVGSANAVRSTINYSVPMGRQPHIDNLDYSKCDLSLAPAEVRIVDARTLGSDPRLDVEGFACLSHKVDIVDLAESPEAIDRYRVAMAPFMLQVTGADDVFMEGHPVIRQQVPPVASKVPQAPTADFAHSDYSEEGSEQVRALLYEPLSRPGVRRIAMYNMWKLLSKGPTNRPLTLCDARSVAAADIIPGESRFPGFSFETALLRHNPDHRWLYFPALTSDELLVFKQSDSDPTQPRLVPHTAFDDTSCPPDVEPRVSIECRCMAVWYD